MSGEGDAGYGGVLNLVWGANLNYFSFGTIELQKISYRIQGKPITGGFIIACALCYLCLLKRQCKYERAAATIEEC